MHLYVSVWERERKDGGCIFFFYVLILWGWNIATSYKERQEREELCRPLFHPLECSLCASHSSFCVCNLMRCVFVCPIPPVHPWLQCHMALHFCMPPEEKWSLTLHIFYLNCSVGRISVLYIFMLFVAYSRCNCDKLGCANLYTHYMSVFLFKGAGWIFHTPHKKAS